MNFRLFVLGVIVLSGVTACGPAKIANCSITKPKSDFTVVKADITNRSTKSIVTTGIVLNVGDKPLEYTLPALIAPKQTVGLSQIRSVPKSAVNYGPADCKITSLKYSDGSVWRAPSR